MSILCPYIINEIFHATHIDAHAPHHAAIQFEHTKAPPCIKLFHIVYKHQHFMCGFFFCSFVCFNFKGGSVRHVLELKTHLIIFVRTQFVGFPKRSEIKKYYIKSVCPRYINKCTHSSFKFYRFAYYCTCGGVWHNRAVFQCGDVHAVVYGWVPRNFMCVCVGRLLLNSFNEMNNRTWFDHKNISL